MAAYIGRGVLGAVIQLGQEVEGQGVAVEQETWPAPFLKGLDVHLKSGEIESLEEKKGKGFSPHLDQVEGG